MNSLSLTPKTLRGPKSTVVSKKLSAYKRVTIMQLLESRTSTSVNMLANTATELRQARLMPFFGAIFKKNGKT
jgi:hypothetical protein